MINLGIIGTNWISNQFVQAAESTGDYQCVSVFSRKKESGESFVASLTHSEGIDVYTDMEAFLSDSDLDTVYIASPNSLHYEQSKKCLLHGKNVIVEKPACTHSSQIEELLTIANKAHLFYFEAARNVHEHNFRKVAKMLPHPSKIEGANFTYMKYSSRYDAVLKGEEPNIFSLKFAGGALMDLGIYLVYAACGWFGKPDSATYTYQKVATGVDGNGTIILRYPNFDVTMMTGKTMDSFLPSEIYIEDRTIRLDAVNYIQSIDVWDRVTDVTTPFETHHEENPMREEASNFAAVMLNPDDPKALNVYKSWCELTLIVHQVMDMLREDANITYER